MSLTKKIVIVWLSVLFLSGLTTTGQPYVEPEYEWPEFVSDERINELVQYAYTRCIERLWEWDLIKWSINYSCKDMILTRTSENGAWWWRVVSPTRDYWLCQLHYPYHQEFINSEEFKDPYNQLDYCLDERERTMNEGWMKWYAYWWRNKNKHLFNNL